MFCIIGFFFTFVMVQSINMNKKTISIRSRINELEIGSTANFPLARYNYIVSCKYRLSLDTGKNFSSTINRKKDVVSVTRLQDNAE